MKITIILPHICLEGGYSYYISLAKNLEVAEMLFNTFPNVEPNFFK